ncbi:protein BTG1 [Bombina bombina]|uniref:protein BTG1 n=1 Tax=Bombina bombina TaxID=8345 RepID=UPI00235A9FDB|nr:protein BTG1 [Bombina bombina]
MITEIATAAAFVSRLLKTSGAIELSQLQQFCQSLQEAMKDHYKQHWFPEHPSRGSGFRCLRINHKMDPLIGRAAGHIGLGHKRLFHLLPSELTVWVDPYEVSYRIGEDGSICVLYEGPSAVGKSLENHASCKEALRVRRNSHSKNYSIMTVSS